MDTTTSSPNALDALRTAEFRLSLRGYDVDEVDDFLERAAVEADQLREQMRQASAQVAQANDRVRALEQERAGAPPVAQVASAPAGQSAGTVSKMLEMAERFVEQTRADAEKEAASILADAQDRARQLATDAQNRLADEVARLEGLRQRLGEDVEKMARQLESERARLSGSLHDLIGWLDKHLQPSTFAALRESSDASGDDETSVAESNGQTSGGAQVLSLDDARHEE